MSIWLKLIIIVAALGGLLVGGVQAYHWSRILECERPQSRFEEKATRAQVVSKLGGPWESAGPTEGGNYTRRWPLDEKFEARVRESSETLAYIDGEFVYFIHLDKDGRASSFTCIGN
jgi:hypothetical protein